MIIAKSKFFVLSGLAMIVLLSFGCGKDDKREILNVSYDPTREFYSEFDKLFVSHWKTTKGEDISVQQSHGGSGKQARAVIDGLSADVVTLALAYDIDMIAEKSKSLPENWSSRLPQNSCPYTSTIVFLVRKGNPKNIKDWNDLAGKDVSVICPNPKTSGGARWNYLAAWAWAQNEYKGDEGKIMDYMKAWCANVPVWDSGARGSTTTFVERKLGDVLLAWENEALLMMEKSGEQDVEIVTPPTSILAEPPVAWIDGNMEKKGTADIAKAYLEYLYTPEAAKIIAKYHYRPTNTQGLNDADLVKFKKINLITIDQFFGGWKKAQDIHFSEGGYYDKIMESKMK